MMGIVISVWENNEFFIGKTALIFIKIYQREKNFFLDKSCLELNGCKKKSPQKERNKEKTLTRI